MKLAGKIICLLVTVLMSVTLFGCSTTLQTTNPTTSVSQSTSTQGTTQESTTEPFKEVTLKYLMDWNGAGFLGAKDPVNNPVAKAIKDKTGVSIEVEWVTVPEDEKLNLIFASGDLPDIINAPLWGVGDTCTDILTKAALQGMLLPLDDLLDQYSPFLKSALTKSLAADYVANILENKDFGGKHYFLPWQTTASNDDIVNWAYGVYARKDIVEALGVDPASIKTSDDLYKFLLKVRDGGFKDINGKPVIPAGTWANGSSYSLLANSFNENNLTEFSLVDGKYVLSTFSPLLDQSILFIRKLVSENLLDQECFTQNDTTAKEKMSAGKIAVWGGNFLVSKQIFDITLYKDHPEMRYIPLGPVLDANGIACGEISLDGRSGSPTLVLTNTCKDPAAAIRLIDYVNSDEGKRLVCYGIEGTHYTLVDGKPRMNADWLAKYQSDPQILRDEGIQGTFTFFITLDDRVSKWGEKTPGTAAEPDADYELAKKAYPNVFKSGFRVSYFKNGYPEIDKLNLLLANANSLEKAYFAKSDEEALAILNAYRQQLIDGGIRDYEKYINDQAAASGRTDLIN